MPVPEKSRQRVLVLGASGMLGHKLIQQLSAAGLPVVGAIRNPAMLETRAARTAFAGAERILTDVDLIQDDALVRAIDAARPDVVVNAIGLIKQDDAASDPILPITINSLLPHRLATFCGKNAIRLIHFSTDCVFGGEQGPYREDSPANPQDIYGRSKLLGEVTGRRCLTIRSSFVGRELRGRLSLVEWFLSQRGRRVLGYTGALYTGVTTIVMSDLVADIIMRHPDLHGVYHVASDPISKYQVLNLLNHHFQLGVELVPSDSLIIDRRLDGGSIRERIGFIAPPWDDMVTKLYQDPTPYAV